MDVPVICGRISANVCKLRNVRDNVVRTGRDGGEVRRRVAMQCGAASRDHVVLTSWGAGPVPVACHAAQQFQQDPNDPTKWQMVAAQPVGTSVSSATQQHLQAGQQVGPA